MHRSTRLILLALTLVVAALGSLVSPALADHEVTNPPHGHWGNGFSPELVIDTSPGWGSNFPNVSDAAKYWQDTGFINGFRNLFVAVQDNNGCAEKGGAVKVCVVAPWDYRLQGGAGYTYDHWVCDLPGGCTIAQVHIYSATVFVQAGLSDYRRQQVYRHELGHAVGLGHTADPNCVMRADANVYNGTRCQHDMDAIADLYIYHRTG